ncbi:MAG: carboxypeptidase-like regulatory domain-containing protein [Bacteroidota bacterium]
MRPTLLFLLLSTICSTAQSQVLKMVVADQNSRQPIADTFVFIENSSNGTATNDAGEFELNVQGNQQLNIVFSHLNYQTAVLKWKSEMTLQDTFFLIPQELNLQEISITQKGNSRLRKRRLKRFTSAFLGSDINPSMVKILNPEVLLFKEENQQLVAEANEPIQIENRKLGYIVQFYLEEFELSNNNDLRYKGRVFFQPMGGNKKTLAKFKRNRRKAYLIGSNYFFTQLVQGNLDKEVYEVGFAAINSNSEVVAYKATSPDSLNIEKLDDYTYVINIKEYLSVRNKSAKIQNGNKEDQSFASSFSTDIAPLSKVQNEMAVSYLKSATGYIIVNTEGRILNPTDIEEYGYWTSQRIAALLPFDYQ